MGSVVNVTKELVLARNVDVTRSFFHRLRGLIGKRDWADLDGLWIEPCTGIHAIGLRFPIDVVLVDESEVVRSGTQVGDVLDLRLCREAIYNNGQ